MQMNKNLKEDILVFYTDCSLKKIRNKDGEKMRQMGASWVQVDKKEEKVFEEGYIGAHGWPMSTKAELLAIWCVLLMIPQKKKVRIITNSEVAITSLTGKKKKIQEKQWIRETNYNIKRSIAKIASLKEIDLELVKIKGHSGNSGTQERICSQN